MKEKKKVITWKSKAMVPTKDPKIKVERVHRGHYFVTIHYAADRVSKGDEDKVKEVAQEIIDLVADTAPMFMSDKHPSPPQHSKGSKRKGATEEMHDEPHKLAHWHIELTGENRDKGLDELEIWNDIKDTVLDDAEWL